MSDKKNQGPKAPRYRAADKKQGEDNKEQEVVVEVVERTFDDVAEVDAIINKLLESGSVALKEDPRLYFKYAAKNPDVCDLFFGKSSLSGDQMAIIAETDLLPLVIITIPRMAVNMRSSDKKERSDYVYAVSNLSVNKAFRGMEVFQTSEFEMHVLLALAINEEGKPEPVIIWLSDDQDKTHAVAPLRQNSMDVTRGVETTQRYKDLFNYIKFLIGAENENINAVDSDWHPGLAKIPIRQLQVQGVVLVTTKARTLEEVMSSPVFAPVGEPVTKPIYFFSLYKQMLALQYEDRSDSKTSGAGRKY